MDAGLAGTLHVWEPSWAEWSSSIHAKYEMSIAQHSFAIPAHAARWQQQFVTGVCDT